MKLTVKERINLVAILPLQGDITTLKQLRVFREALTFTDKETADWKIDYQPEMGRVTWDEKIVKDVEIDISDRMFKLVIKKLRDLNKVKKLEESHITLWDKFIEPHLVKENKKDSAK